MKLCVHWSACQACTLMRLPPLGQHKRKLQELERGLGRGPRISAAEAPILPLIPTGSSLGTRISAKLALHQKGPAEPVELGLFKAGTRVLVPIPECLVHHPRINQLAKSLLRHQGLPKVQHSRHRGAQPGCLKYLSFRVSPEGTQAQVVISHTGIPELELKRWIANQPKDLGFYGLSLEEGHESEIFRGSLTHLQGPKDWELTLGSVPFKLSPTVFTQNNHSLHDRLIKEALQFASPSLAIEARGLLDLYGGFGAYSLNACDFKRRTLVEQHPLAVGDAQRAAKAIGALGFTGQISSAESYLLKASKAEAQGYSHMIVNPPRAGLSRELIKALGSPKWAGIKALNYVSCAPQSLGRDLRALRVLGFKVAEYQPIDLFPHTKHIETLTRLWRT